MSPIRSLRVDDLPALADLRRRTFRISHANSSEALIAYFRAVFLENPWRDDDLASLVCEDTGGRIVGFIGIVPRPMEYRGELLRVAVSTQFMVEPGSRGIPALQLMQRLFSGPQDLTLGDAAPDSARKIWEGFGGTTAVIHSLFWHRALRPFRDRAVLWGQGWGARAARLALRPVLGAADGVVTRLLPGRYRQRTLPGTLEPLDPAGFATALPQILLRRRLRPRYTAEGIAWLLAHLERVPERGRPRLRLVRDEAGRPAGCFIYYATSSGSSTVLLFAALEDRAALVLSHLCQDAWREGAIAVRGRLDPPLVTALTDAGATLGRDGPWVLIQSRRPELIEAFHAGDAFVSNLDGERWMAF